MSRKPKSFGERDPRLEAICFESLVKAGAAELAGKIVVFWNPRLRTTAGLACYQRLHIYLNPRLNEFGVPEVLRTLKHELAHFLAAHRAGRKKIDPHGKEWQKACADLGIPGEARCHTLPFPRSRKERKHLYECPSCGLILRRVRRLSSPSACLVCCKKYAGGRYDTRFRFVPCQVGKPKQSFFAF